jgi:predicted RNA-binding protein associated with RNAse of E/G family
MHKKDILGNYIKKNGVVYSSSIRKLTNGFEGYSAIIYFLAGSRELRVNDDGKELLLAGDGYKWLMYLPMNEPWCLTAFYDPDNELLEWYFDISKRNFLDENGTPCIDDIFLDLIIMPNGKAVTIDANELQDALDKSEISRKDFDHAYQVRDSILQSKWNNAAYLKEVSNALFAEFDSSIKYACTDETKRIE